MSAQPRTEVSAPLFLADGGEMGALMRAHDWAATPIGTPEGWPPALRMAVRLMLNTGHPMYVFWGPKHLCFYNDAYRRSIGPERHPGSLGRPGREVWTEIWDVIGPQISQVMRGEGATWHENHLIPITRHGRREEVWWTYSYSPIDDPAAPDGVGGVLVVCTETTGQVLAAQLREAMLRLDEVARRLGDVEDLAFASAELLGRSLRACRAGYGAVDDDAGTITVRRPWSEPGLPDIAGVHAFADYGTYVEALRRGDAVAVEDVTRDARTAVSADRFAALGIRAYLEVPIVEHGRFVASVFVQSLVPRHWPEEEVTFVRDFAARARAAVARARAEAETRESEARFRNMADHAPVIVWTTDPDGVCTYLNRTWYEFTGQIESEALGFGWLDATHPDDKPEATRVFLAANAARAPFRLDYRLRYRDGTYRRSIDAAAPRFTADGAFAGYVGSVIDIEDRLAAQERLRFLLDLSDRLRAHPDDAMATAAAMLRRRLGTSRAGYALVEEGTSAVRIIDDRDYSVPALDGQRLDLDDFGPMIAEGLRAGRTITVEDVASEPGTEHFAATHLALGTRSVMAVPLLREGRLRALLSISHREARAWTDAEVELVEEVAARTWAAVEQARAEAELRDGERRLRAALAELDGVYAVAPVGLCVLDAELRFVRINERLAKINGVPAVDHIGRTVREVIPGVADQAEPALRRILESGEPQLGIEITGETPARPGELRVWEENWLPLRDAAGRIIGVNITAEDVTERRAAAQALARSEAELRQLNETLEARVRAEVAARQEAQAMLAHSQRLEALGQLAGGIAHDFNNVLQAVQGAARLIEARPDDAERTRRLMGMAAEAAARGSAVTRRLLAFSRRADLHAQPIDAAELLTGLAEVLSHTMGDGIRAEVTAPADLAPVVADKGQLETVLVNLASNARDAMGGQGVISLTAALEVVAAGGTRPPVRLAPGEYLRLSVRDTGVGMPPDVLTRVTEPFFTTKPKGQGTGLGLAMARGFAEQSGGALHIESAPGAGTTVSLWLPAASASPGDAASQVRTGDPAGRGDGQPARLLLVDDEPVVREVVAEGLRAEGYHVTAIAGAAEALALLDSGEAVDAIVSDLSMPGVDGLALIGEAHRRRPGLPAILLTGFATDAADLAMRGAMGGAFSLLRKPVEVTVLAERLAALIGGTEARSEA